MAVELAAAADVVNIITADAAVEAAADCLEAVTALSGLFCSAAAAAVAVAADFSANHLLH